MRKKEYLKSRSVIVQGIHSPKRFWFACGLSLGLVSLPLSTFANNWSNQLGSSIQKSIQQNRIITGSVIDESGEALIGVSVLVKGTTLGTVTDLDGNFTLEVPTGAILVVSELVSLRHGRDEGLLAEDVLSGQKRRLSLRIVQAVGGGDIDQLNVRVGQHGVIVGVDLRDAELLCQRLAGGLLPGADRLTAERRDLYKLCRHRAGDGASAEDADIHGSAPPYI